MPRVMPPLDDPLDEPLNELDPLRVEPFEVLPPVVEWVFVVGVGVAVRVVVFEVEALSLFGVPAYVSAASQPNPAVATRATTAAVAVSSERRRVASARRSVRARSSGVIWRP
jgi:hypothetical protein